MQRRTPDGVARYDTPTNKHMQAGGRMPVVAVANPKGGVGKSTLSTNLAGHFARQGHAVMLGDLDRQQSSKQWLAIRPEAAPPIVGWDVRADGMVRPPKGTTHVVIDTPAGLHGRKLASLLKVADRLIVPVQPSLFDIQATHQLLQDLRADPNGAQMPVALVAMRVKEGTISSHRLDEFAATLQAPLVTHLRDTQNYVHLAAHGLTLFDVAPSRVERDLAQWAPLIDWLET